MDIKFVAMEVFRRRAADILPDMLTPERAVRDYSDIYERAMEEASNINQITEEQLEVPVDTSLINMIAQEVFKKRSEEIPPAMLTPEYAVRVYYGIYERALVQAVDINRTKAEHQDLSNRYNFDDLQNQFKR